MIGIVLVSHSATLAEGVRELAVQMVRDKVPIAVAGGVDNLYDPIGTDPFRVLHAIEAVYSEDGVIVLMDLGSALMSAEASLDFLAPEQREHIYLCEAPLVEGAIAAAVRAMAGGTVTQVLMEARGALNAKREQLLPFLPLLEELATSQRPSAVDSVQDVEAAQTLTLTVPNRLGLHARPAAKLVELTTQFAAEVRIVKGDKDVSAKSINEIAILDARQCDELVFRASGPAATAVLDAIAAFSAANFGDLDDYDGLAATPVRSSAETNTKPLIGIPASSGIAIGPAVRYETPDAAVEVVTVEDSAGEWARLLCAIEEATRELEQLQMSIERQTSVSEAEIFSAHIGMLRDPALLAVAEEQIHTQKRNAEAAWQHAVLLISEEYRSHVDERMRSHVLDVFDVGQRVLRCLLADDTRNVAVRRSDLLSAESHSVGAPAAPVILVANELIPSVTASFDPAGVMGIVTAQGSATDHSAILARALNIPAVVGVARIMEHIQFGETIALDGDQGKVWLAPSSEDLAVLEQARLTWLSHHAASRRLAKAPAQLRSGEPVNIAANINSLRDIKLALANGAEGVGLFRSEFLFMERDRAPNETEQLAVYTSAGRALGNRPLIIRTLDIGGDKPLSYLKHGHEGNPFLGVRGLRLFLEHPELFKPQLRALLRAAAEHPIKILLPMVSILDELLDTRRIIAALQAELRQERLAYCDQSAIGVMIETPAAVLMADALAQHADFFSLGTNDLAQYIMAADRTNPRVALLAHGIQPALLRAIHHIVQAAQQAKIEVSICGEIAGDPLVAPLLVGLGLTQLSMNAPAIPAVKERLRQISLEEANTLAAQALQCVSASEVTHLLNVAGQGSGAGNL
jgi:phosphocarrier protein FPr